MTGPWLVAFVDGWMDGWVGQVCVSNFRLSVLASLPFFSDLLRQLASVSNQLLEATAAMASSFRGLAADFDQVGRASIEQDQHSIELLPLP